MFIGHFAVALAAKRVAPATSLGVLFAAAQFADLLWPVLLLAGVERAEVVSTPGAVIPLRFVHYPYSHSLLAAAVASVLVGLLWLGWSRSIRAACVVGALVLSHWFLDLTVHVPDLPLVPGGVRWGLGLWQWPALALGLELALFAFGAGLYLRSTRAVDGIGRWGLWSLLALLVGIQLANAWGPPPPGMTPVIWSANAMWLLVAWAWWVDGHRLSRLPVTWAG